MRFLAAFRAAAFLLSAILLAYPVAAQDKGPAKTLAAPTGVWAAQTSPTEITLVWDSVPSARGFKISSKSGVINVGKMTRYVVHITTMFGIPVQYHIEAVGEKGEVSPKVAFPEVTPEKGTVAGALPRPSSVSAKVTAPGIVTVTWTAVPEATAYHLGRSVAPNGLQTLCSMCPTKTEYVDNTAIAGAKHIYSVQAIGPGGASQRTMSNVVIPTGSPGPNPPAGGVGSAPKGPITAGCTGGQRYKTCTSTEYELTALEVVKAGSAFCPGGYAAVGGGYGGSLTTALIQASRPLPGTGKEHAGWTVLVARLIFPAGGDAAYMISSTARAATPIRFTVFVMCAADS